MKVLIKIALILAILAGGGSLYFANELAGKKTQLEQDNKQLTDRSAALTRDRDAARDAEAQARQEAAAAQEEASQTKATLEARLVELSQLRQERDQVQRERTELTAQLDEAKTKLALAEEELQKIQAMVVERAPEVKDPTEFIEKIAALEKEKQALASEHKVLSTKLQEISAENKELLRKVEEKTKTPINLRGRVASVESRWGFVVLDIGHNDGVQPNTEFLVYRNNRLVSKVHVTGVNPTTSIAEIIPEFRRLDPRTGDLVVH
jgi:cell shape-determining protein MreC